MIILVENKFLQKLIGIESVGRDKHHVNIFVVSFFSFGMVSTAFLSFVYFVYYINDFKVATASMLAGFGLPIILTMYWNIIFNRRHFYALLYDLQDIVNERQFQ